MAQLAIDAFLGNPMLFYAHQGLFASGMGAFNKISDAVNKLSPVIQWRSLGYIAKRLYLEKLRQDGNYDVRAYSATLQIENRHCRDVMFFIEKEEDFTLPLTVLVDGQPYAHRRLGNRLLIDLPVRDGMSRELAIRYEKDINLSAIDLSENSLRIDAVRYLSDFRDNIVSKNRLGRLFIRSYSHHGAAWNRLTLLFGVLGLWLLIWHISHKIRRGVQSRLVRIDQKPRNGELDLRTFQ